MLGNGDAERGERMQVLRGIHLIADTTEESMPNFDAGFPCITNRAELNAYPDAVVPWHWHSTVELFYISKGELTYRIPGMDIHFEQGSGGMLLPEIIHRSVWSSSNEVIQLLHQFDPSLLFGEMRTRMAQKYVHPMLDAAALPLIRFDPKIESHAPVLALLKGSFALDGSDLWYEFRLRECLSEIWLRTLALSKENGDVVRHAAGDPRLKSMMTFINTHLEDKLTVRSIADAAFVSTRVCYRMFREYLHTAPNEYIRSCRIRKACVLLNREKVSVTEAAQRCGFDDSSYFARVFREMTGYTPLEFKKMAR